jgi:lipopolysaccharide export LptBFGC system permease protein LptF
LVVVLLFFVFWSLYFVLCDKEPQYNDQKTKNNNTAAKRQRTTIRRQKTKNKNTTTKRQRTTILVLFLFFFFLSLLCFSLSFGRFIVFLCLLVALLLFFVFWSLYC